MTYITTQHPFPIDERHPTDVFDEMSNFFSLYTVAQNSVQQMSLQLTLPAKFNLETQAKLAKAHQQFLKAVRYSIPDIHILPVQYSDDTETNTLQLMLQHSDITAVLEDELTPFYQKVLGVFLPKFEATTSETGLYPEQTPIQALPVPQPIQPTPQPAIPATLPVNVPVNIPVNVSPQPVQMPSPVLTNPTPISREPISSPPKSQMPAQPTTKPIQQPIITLPKLPKTTVSIKPYRDLLTQAIVTQAQQEGNGRSITQITLKSSDSLTTAVIEAIFASFNPTANARAYDAIDMVSYGLEELRPTLARIGVNLAEDTQFSLNAKANATPQDFAELSAGQVSEESIKISVKNSYGDLKEGVGNTSVPPKPANQPIIKPTIKPIDTPTINTAQADNNNSLNITINVQIRDDMGERTVKARQFPLNFTTQVQTDGHSIKLAISQPTIQPTINKQTGQLFSVVENQGNLSMANINPAIQIIKAGKILQNGAVLMPNDVLEIGQCQIRFSVGS